MGSGHGKTCGRGQKGQKARATGNIGKLHFQGGQTPIQRRLPKRGFRRLNPSRTVEINVERLASFAVNGEVLIEHFLRKVTPRRDVRIKVLGRGEIGQRLLVEAHSFSESAREKIEEWGGKCSVVDRALERRRSYINPNHRNPFTDVRARSEPTGVAERSELYNDNAKKKPPVVRRKEVPMTVDAEILSGKGLEQLAQIATRRHGQLLLRTVGGTREPSRTVTLDTSSPEHMEWFAKVVEAAKRAGLEPLLELTED